MKLLNSIAVFLLDYISQLLLRKLHRTPFQVAAKSFLVGAVSVAALPFVVDIFFSALRLHVDGQKLTIAAISAKMGGDSPDTLIVLVMIGCSVFFFLFAQFLDRKTDELVSVKEIKGEYKFGKSTVSCYVGDISRITEADVVVTSEDTDLDLGSMSGTSVSGRIRRLMATTNNHGEVVKDNLQNFVDSWKSRNQKRGNFDLGTTVIVPDAYEASQKNIKTIVLGVAIRKNEQGGSTIQASAICKIIENTMREVSQQNYRTVFFPVFGLGSGGVKPEDAINATVDGLAASLGDNEVTVYLGVYKRDHQLSLMAKLQKESLKH